MNVTEITYNCTPDSLADVPEADFAEAFENEIYAIPLFQNASVRVTFHPAHASEPTAHGHDLPADPADLHERIRNAAQRAFRHCCEVGNDG